VARLDVRPPRRPVIGLIDPDGSDEYLQHHPLRRESPARCRMVDERRREARRGPSICAALLPGEEATWTQVRDWSAFAFRVRCRGAGSRSTPKAPLRSSTCATDPGRIRPRSHAMRRCISSRRSTLRKRTLQSVVAGQARCEASHVAGQPRAAGALPRQRAVRVLQRLAGDITAQLDGYLYVPSTGMLIAAGGREYRATD